jgi:fibronectin type 3 domain-containing protein
VNHKENYEFSIFNFELLRIFNLGLQVENQKLTHAQINEDEAFKDFRLKIENFHNLKFRIHNSKFKVGPVLLILTFLFGLNTRMSFGQALTSGADFLRIDSGARSEAMGEAFTGVADDVDALTFNPAGLALVQKPQVAYLRMLYLADIAYNFGGAALPVPDGDDTWGFGAGVINLGTAPFDSTNGLAPSVSAGYNAIMASAALRIKSVVAFGVTGKFIMENLGGYNAQAFGGDVGVLLTPADRLGIGLAVLNLGQQVQFISEGDPLPTMLRLGISYKILDVPHHSLLLSADNGYDLISQSYLGGGGAEYWYDKTLALRAGYTGDAYQQHLTAGLGVNVNGIVEFDYAYAPMGTLGDTHRFSLTLRLDTGEVAGLAAPAGFSARPLDGAVALSWRPSPSPAVTGYYLYVQKPGSDKMIRISPSALTDTTVRLKHLVNGQNYNFAITSVSAAGRESSPVQLSVVPGASAVAASLMAPTGLKVALSATGDGFNLSWDGSDAAGYYLYFADDQGKPTAKISKLILENKITLKDVNPTRNYSFVLTAVNQAGGESPASAPLKVSLADLKKTMAGQLLPPAHLILVTQNGKIHMSWDAVNGASKYNLYVSHDGGGSFSLLTPQGYSKTEVTLGGMKPGKSYTFAVSSLSAGGKESQKAVQTLSAQ